MDFEPLYSAFTSIAKELRENDIMNLGIDTDSTNLSNDIQKKIDLLANKLITDAIRKIPNAIGYISEENSSIVFTDDAEKMNSGLVVVFDPIDGSKNVLANITIGTIYSIYNYDKLNDKIISIVESGYCLYGPSTLLVKTVKTDTKESVHLYQLDSCNKFKFNREVTRPTTNTLYAINMSYSYDKDIHTLVNQLNMAGCTQRWVGAMVADCHQILIRGGTFLYPRTNNNPNGKIRLLYEAIPFAHILSVLGGIAVDINCRDILDYIPYIELNKTKVHKEISLLLSTFYSKREIQTLLELNDLIKC